MHQDQPCEQHGATPTHVDNCHMLAPLQVLHDPGLLLKAKVVTTSQFLVMCRNIGSI